jgi:hypothetical protein
MTKPWLELPDEVDVVPEGHADCYEICRYDPPRYRLTAVAQDYIARCQSALDAADAEHAQALEDERTAHQRSKEQLRDRAIAQALNKALTSAGANPNVRHGAVAQLQQIWNFTVNGDDVAICSANGDIDLYQAIEHWLSTNVGEPFSTRKPLTVDTVQRMKQITTR